MKTKIKKDSKFFEKLLNEISYGVYATDLNRKIIYWNQTASQITGYERKEVINKRCKDDLLCHIDKEGKKLCDTDFCPLYKAMITNTRSSLPQVVYAKHKNGKRIPLKTMLAPLTNAEGEVIGGIETFIDVSEEVYEQELAKKVQRRFVLNFPEKLKGVKIKNYYQPADMLGGDFFNVIDIGGGRTLIVCGDVRGHGVSSALITSSVVSIIKNICLTERKKKLTAPYIAFETEKRYSSMNIEDKHIAASFFIIDSVKNTVCYTNAGHCEFLIYRKSSKKTEVFIRPGAPIGLGIEEIYEEVKISLKKGDKIFICTDGIYELEGKGGERFGVKRMADFFEKNAAFSQTEFSEKLYHTLFKFKKGVDSDDDITYVLIDYKGVKSE